MGFKAILDINKDFVRNNWSVVVRMPIDNEMEFHFGRTYHVNTVNQIELYVAEYENLKQYDHAINYYYYY